MTKNPSIPDTWGIPDEQATKVQQALSKKSIRPEDALQKTIEDLARDIAIIETDPMEWGWWVGYLLETLEGESLKRMMINDFEKMLRTLSGELLDRVDSR